MRTELPIIQGKLQNDRITKTRPCYCGMKPKKNLAKLETSFQITTGKNCFSISFISVEEMRKLVYLHNLQDSKTR